MNNYDNLNYCINLIDDFIDNRTKYKVDPIVINEIKLENILKEENFNYEKILDNLKFDKIVNNKNIYFGKNYEVHISKYDSKITNLSTKQNIGLIYNYIFSEFLTQNNLDIILLNLMNFSVLKKDIKLDNLDNFNNDDILLVSIYYNKSDTFTEYLKNGLSDDDMKKIFFMVLFNLYKFSAKLKNFRHNKLNLNSIRLIKSNKKVNFNIGDIKFSFDTNYDVKITDFENSSSNNLSNFLSIDNQEENPFYDVHYFFSAFMSYIKREKINVNDSIIHFIESIIPIKYRNYDNNNFQLDEKVFNSDESQIIIPSDILKKNIFFSDFIMDITVTPISSLSENSLDKYSKKDKKINYDIEINSLTETSNNNSRMIAKNIKYKNKKTYSKYNNIKDSMIKGTRRLYVPTRNNLNEGNMSSDVLATVEKDKHGDRKEKRDKRRDRRKTEDEEEVDLDAEVQELDDESSIENEDVKMERSKGKKSAKKSSKKGKKSRSLSESSLESLSSDGVDTYHQKTMTGTEVERKAGRKMAMEPQEQNDILKMLPEGYSGPIPQSMWNNMQPQQTGPKINAIGRVLGHSADMAQPQGLPAAPVGMPEMGMPQMGMPQMGMPQMGMPDMGGMDMNQLMAAQQGMPQMGMPQMQMPQGMPQMGMPMQAPQQSVLLSEGSMMNQAQQMLQQSAQPEPVAQPHVQQMQQQAPQMTFQQALQQGGSRQKRVISLKKDFFF